MYIMIAFIGSCFAGAKATSHDFLILRMSVSSGVGGLRVCCFASAARWGFSVSLILNKSGTLGRLTLPVTADEKPGGSCIEDADLDFGLGGEWSSRTHEGYDGSMAMLRLRAETRLLATRPRV